MDRSIDILLDQLDDRSHFDFCRLLAVVWWNMCCYGPRYIKIGDHNRDRLRKDMGVYC